jgi:hypothetical protein
VSGQPAVVVGLTVLALLAVLTAILILRRVIISRRGGVVECALRHSADAPWRHGLAEYRRGQLYWHRSMSMRLRPHAVFDRSQLAVVASRPAVPAEDRRLGPGMVVLRCKGIVRHRGRPAGQRVVQLAMSQPALTGLLAWLEASPNYVTRRAG